MLKCNMTDIRHMEIDFSENHEPSYFPIFSILFKKQTKKNRGPPYLATYSFGG